VRLGQQRLDRGQLSDLRSLEGWFHETLAQASGSEGLASLLTQLRRKIVWMYAVDAPATSSAVWQEYGAITDAIARGDADRARLLTTQHTERTAALHRLRRPPVKNGKNGNNPKATVSGTKPAVNTARDPI
jgi:DNA-binding GntR family transcriptional regulator